MGDAEDIAPGQVKARAHRQQLPGTTQCLQRQVCTTLVVTTTSSGQLAVSTIASVACPLRTQATLTFCDRRGVVRLDCGNLLKFCERRAAARPECGRREQ